MRNGSHSARGVSASELSVAWPDLAWPDLEAGPDWTPSAGLTQKQVEVATVQFRHVHPCARNRVMSVYHDDRPCLGIVRLTKNL